MFKTHPPQLRRAYLAAVLVALGCIGSSCSDDTVLTGAPRPALDGAAGRSGGSDASELGDASPPQQDATAEGADAASSGDVDAGAPDATLGSEGGANVPLDASALIPPGDTVMACPGATLIDPEVLNLPACPLCADALCVPDSLLGGMSGTHLLADCDDGASKCVPTSYVATTGSFRLKGCTAFGAAEGRCVSRCVPQVGDQVGLEQDVCGDNELCAPCYMPTDGSSTGACELGCDPGPSEPPYLFDPCCGGDGICIPSNLVPADQQGALGTDTCSGQDELCAPTSYIDPDFIPATCNSLLDAEGRCIPACVEAVQSTGDLLPQAGCQEGELCAPCYDQRNGEETGACRINGDEPTEPAVVFDDCCQGGGRCVPTDLVPEDQLVLLAEDTCGGGGADASSDAGVVEMRCAPTFAVMGNGQPDCASEEHGPGICYHPCTMPALAPNVPKGDCAGDLLCLPCYFNGTSLGICDPSIQPPMLDGGALDASSPSDGG